MDYEDDNDDGLSPHPRKRRWHSEESGLSNHEDFQTPYPEDPDAEDEE